MTPQQQALNNDLPHTEEFKSLTEKVDNLTNGQQEIKYTLQEELKSQMDFKDYVQDEFDKGTAKFAKVENRMDEIEEKMEKGLEKIAESQNNLAKEIHDKKTEELTQEVRALKEEKIEKAKNQDKLFYGAIGTFISLIIYNAPTIIQIVVKALQE
jgi:predicted nuclease with TOPRIM domain